MSMNVEVIEISAGIMAFCNGVISANVIISAFSGINNQKKWHGMRMAEERRRCREERGSEKKEEERKSFLRRRKKGRRERRRRRKERRG